ncbi:cell division protein SepF [Actinotignum urinale]|uniref:Cell division protein SepF n=1 Tax=Actinotignum urinale TaxID=190146 RepID=A0AAW9HQI8_9ACTO|nr:cell division protein SepF [Actinotignum urinale]MDY5129119.1 cell division protein SepF [Actinotignum urinale]MDY5132307.1 cell division protein SepF [Actinotignum urinale]MDY5154937.1 cell division protein SepF [Actinotignum urinale]MDY5160808.1 cell division protein SepF [Actinotignum urinale]WIK59190.1 cell division protein SepF [Actinotignum urinale]
MSLLKRFVSKATLNDDYDRYDDSSYYDDEAYAEEDEIAVTDLHAVAEQPDISRILTAKPRTFNDIRSFAEQYRQGIPVIVNLSETDDVVRNRIVDFATGMCFALYGHFSQVSEDVVLMVPQSVRLENQRSQSRDHFS